MKTPDQKTSLENARQSMNPETNEEHGNIMPDEEKMEEAFKLTASHNIEDPKDKKKDDDDKDSNENPNNGAMDDEEVTDGETKTGFDEDDNGRMGE